MSQLRDEAVQQVNADFAAGRLQWSKESIDSLREPWGVPNIGEFDENVELHEADVEPGLCRWKDDGSSSSAGSGHESDAEEMLAAELGEVAAGVAVPIADAVPELEGDDPADVASAREYADRMRVLDEMQALAKANKLESLMHHVTREKHTLRKLFQVGASGSAASPVLRRFLALQNKEFIKKMDETRAETRKRKAEAQELKDAERRLKLDKASARDKEAARLDALKMLPQSFTSEALGQGHPTGLTKAHIAARVQLLERLRLRSPDLPPDLAVQWESFAQKYAVHLAKRHKGAAAAVILDLARDVITSLGEYALPLASALPAPSRSSAPSASPRTASASASASASSSSASASASASTSASSASDGLSRVQSKKRGDPRAFEIFVRRELRWLPRDSNSLVV